MFLISVSIFMRYNNSKSKSNIFTSNFSSLFTLFLIGDELCWKWSTRSEMCRQRNIPRANYWRWKVGSNFFENLISKKKYFLQDKKLICISIVPFLQQREMLKNLQVTSKVVHWSYYSQDKWPLTLLS